MAGKTPRVLAAQEALDAAIREMAAASDEMDQADATRLGNFEEVELNEKLKAAALTHWVVATSRTYWERDEDDPEDTNEYPRTNVGALVRDDTAPYWVVSGLLRRAADIVEEG